MKIEQVGGGRHVAPPLLPAPTCLLSLEPSSWASPSLHIPPPLPLPACVLDARMRRPAAAPLCPLIRASALPSHGHPDTPAGTCADPSLGLPGVWPLPQLWPAGLPPPTASHHASDFLMLT